MIDRERIVYRCTRCKHQFTDPNAEVWELPSCPTCYDGVEVYYAAAEIRAMKDGEKGNE